MSFFKASVIFTSVKERCFPRENCKMRFANDKVIDTFFEYHVFATVI